MRQRGRADGRKSRHDVWKATVSRCLRSVPVWPKYGMLLTLSPLAHTHTHTLSLAQFRQRIKNIATFTLFLHKNCSALSCQSRVKTGLFLPYFNTRAVITSWHHISLSQNTTFTLYYSNRNTVAHVFDTVDCMTFKKKRKKWKTDQWQCYCELWGMPQQQPKQNSVSEVLKHLYVHGTLVSQAVQAQ